MTVAINRDDIGKTICMFVRINILKEFKTAQQIKAKMYIEHGTYLFQLKKKF